MCTVVSAWSVTFAFTRSIYIIFIKLDNFFEINYHMIQTIFFICCWKNQGNSISFEFTTIVFFYKLFFVRCWLKNWKITNFCEILLPYFQTIFLICWLKNYYIHSGSHKHDNIPFAMLVLVNEVIFCCLGGRSLVSHCCCLAPRFGRSTKASVSYLEW